MKLSKLVMTLLAGCALAESAHAAAVTLHLYGSTAYRRASFIAIGNLYGAGVSSIVYDTGSAITTTTDRTQASPAFASTNILWHGTISTGSLAGQSVDIYCNWAGSVGGVTSVADDTHPVYSVFIPADNIFGHFSSSAVDVAMADCFQDATPVNASVTGFSALNENIVAVLEFIWAKGNGSPAGMTNMPPYAARALLQNGQVVMSQITGNTNDSTNIVYLTGRNDDSGTRIVTETDAGYPVGNALIQYTITTATNYNYAGPAADGLGDGYASGGSVSTALRASRTPGSAVIVKDSHGVFTTNANNYFVGYIAVTDAAGNGSTTGGEGSNTLATVTTGSSTVPLAQWMNYNGLPWSELSIREGAYTMFGFEHCDFRNDASTTVQNFAADLISKQQVEAGAAYIPGTMQLGDMKISRNDDGGPITHN